MSSEAEQIARATRRAKVRDRVLPLLGGMEYAYVWKDKRAAMSAILLLVGCIPHRGRHHFAVFAEGKGVAFSASGRACLLAAGLLPAGGE